MKKLDEFMENECERWTILEFDQLKFIRGGDDDDDDDNLYRCCVWDPD